jgi:hypothetical protein
MVSNYIRSNSLALISEKLEQKESTEMELAKAR